MSLRELIVQVCDVAGLLDTEHQTFVSNSINNLAKKKKQKISITP